MVESCPLQGRRRRDRNALLSSCPPVTPSPGLEGLRQIWDFARCEAEATLAAHGGDVKAAAWHPTQVHALVSDAALGGMQDCTCDKCWLCAIVCLPCLMDAAGQPCLTVSAGHLGYEGCCRVDHPLEGRCKSALLEVTWGVLSWWTLLCNQSRGTLL